MLDTVRRYLQAFGDIRERTAVAVPLAAIADRYSSCALNTAGLAIKTGGSALAKTGATDFYAVATGKLVKIAASTDMPALTGINISAGFFNVVCFYVNSAGVVTAAGGTQGATLGAVVFPQPPQGQALVGFLIITYASAFTGGTTPLDTATTVYVNPLTAFDPTVLVG
jgi:hypothetical protein